MPVHPLRKPHYGFNGPVTEEDLARVRAEFPELMADLRRRRDNPRPPIDRGEWDYDGDMGREHDDTMRDNGGR